jgi:two-component system chemotaxis sensor kinase CheA
MEDQGSRAILDFVSEGEEILEQMVQDLSSVEDAVFGSGTADPDIVNRLFRGAHSLKGVAGMFGFVNLSRVAHRLEDLLDQLRLGRVALAEAAYGLIGEGIAGLRDGLSRIADTGQDPGEDLALPYEARIDRFLKGQTGPAGDDPLATLELDAALLGVLTEYEEHRLRESVRQNKRLLRASVRFPLTEFDVRLGDATATIKELGELVTTLPSAVDTAPDEIAFDLLVATTVGPDELAARLARDEPVIVEIARRTPPPAATAASELEAAPTDSLRSLAKTVRVDISRLDQIMGTVGELVMHKGALSRITDELRNRMAGRGEIPPGELQIQVGELFKQTNMLDRKLRELQGNVMDVRMVELRQVFDKLQRIIRKIARDLGKDVELTILGAETEMDKLIIEDLADPLMHIVRNAIDHGLESGDERAAAGKPRRGHIELRGYQKGDHVVIEVRDDGKGIDTARIRAKCIERGLLRPDEEASEDRLRMMIFDAGFSTADTVSEISGRGVGLDVVKNNLAALGGMIDLVSEPGEGTTFILTLPITLAIIQALFVEVAGETYAVPINAVLKSLALEPDDIEKVDGREVIQFEQRTLPLVRLEEIFRLKRSGDVPDDVNAVVVGLADKRIGLLVDGLRGQQDVVIKPLGSLLRKLPGVAGATDLGDSRTVLVLDVASIIEEATRPGGSRG